MKILVLAAALAATLAAGWSPAQAQTEAEPPAAPAPPPAAAGDPGLNALDPGIEVSLGRPEVKDQVAQAMGVTSVDVPLTIRVTLDVAREVCGETVFDSVTDTNLSCTATRFDPALVDAARQGLQTEANELPQ